MRRALIPLLSTLWLTAIWVVPAGAVDAPACLGLPATIVGTDGKDELTGTEGPDVIWAGAANDRVEGLGGDDVICLASPGDPVPPPQNYDDGHTEEIGIGGPGNDTIVGGPQHNLVWGNSGDDVLMAGERPDSSVIVVNQYYGNTGRDVLLGTAGFEYLVAGRGEDRIESLGGRDILRGGPGADTLQAGAGNDGVAGGPGADDIEGGTGDDVLYGDVPRYGFEPGRFGGDVILGGEGEDELFGQGGRNVLDGGSGTDGCSDPSEGPDAESCERDPRKPAVGVF